MLGGVLQEGAPVVDVRGQPGVGVGVVRVHVAQPHQQRVDLHRVDVPGALGQRDGRVVARPGSDDQDVAQRRLGDVPVGVEVERLLLVHQGQGTGRLVRDVVRGHVQRPGRPVRLVVRQLVVGRPLLRRDDRLQQQQGRDARDGEDLPPPDMGGEQDKQPGAGDDAPGARWLIKEGQPGERRDPGEAAEDVEPVGAQRPEADEHPRRALAQARHHAGYQQEDHAEADRLGQRRGAVQALEGVRAVQRLQDHREREHEGHEQQQCHRCPAQVVALGPGIQEADADAEETCEQDEVGGLGHVDVVRGHPPDQGEFHEEHQEAGERQPGTFPGGFGRRLGGRRLRRGSFLRPFPGRPGGLAGRLRRDFPIRTRHGAAFWIIWQVSHFHHATLTKGRRPGAASG